MNEIASLFWPQLLRGTVAVTVTFLAVLSLLRLLRISSPTLHRIAWCAVLLQGCLIFTFTLPVPWHEPPNVASLPAPPAITEMAFNNIATLDNFAGPPIADVPAPNPTADALFVEPITEAAPLPLSVWFLFVWIAGMLVAVVRWTAGYVWFLRSLNPIAASSEPWQAQWRQLQAEQGVRRPIPLMVTAGQGPMLCRLPRGCVVIVPETLWRHFTATQRRTVLRHELAHYQRSDAFKSLAMRLLALPHWFNPLAWWAVRRFDEAAEWACDDAAVDNSDQSPTSFAKTLLELGTVAAPPLSHSPAASGHSLARRIRRMLSASPIQDHPLKKTLIVLVGVLAVLLNVIRVEFVAKAAPLANPAAEQVTNAGDVTVVDEAETPAPAAQKTLKAKLPQAVQLGIDYLYSQQQPDGSWKIGDENLWDTGVASLCAFALLESGIVPDEPRVKVALEYLRKQKPIRTYEVALQTLALCAAGDKQDLVTIQQNVKSLESGQIQQGAGRGAWSYGTGGVFNMEGGDNSNSEFAVWALDAAANAGAQVKPETWKLAYDHWSKSRLAEGGWGYTTRSPATGTMTCSGIASLVICHRRAFSDDQNDAPDIKELLAPSLKWMAENFAIGQNSKQQNWQLYYLMVLRNAGELSGIQRFGEHSWYAEGSVYLTKHQALETGAWKGAGPMEDEIVSTAMALLFLKTGPPKVTAETSSVEPAEEQDRFAAREAAIAELQRLGGTVSAAFQFGKQRVAQPAATAAFIEVNLDGSRVTDRDLILIKSLSKIASLQIGKSQITDAGLVHIMQVAPVGDLMVQDSQITLAGVRELWRVFPTLRVSGLESLSRGEPEAAKKLLRAAGDEVLARAAAREASRPRSPLEQRILAAMKRRDEAVASYQFQWTQHETEHQGTPAPAYSGGAKGPLEEDVTFTGTSQLIADGCRVRHSYTNAPATGTKGGRTRLNYTYAFDGEVEDSYHVDLGPSQSVYAAEQIANGSHAAKLAVTKLLTNMYSTFDPAMADFDWNNARLLDEQQEVQGRPCYVLQLQTGSSKPDRNDGTSESWWIDPSQGYSLVKYAIGSTDGNISIQIDVNCQEDAKHGWVPILWRFRRFSSNGEPRSTIISNVTDYKINPDLPEETFTIDFPPGTQINR